MEGIVRAITVANTPTTKMEILMTQIISISEACKRNLYCIVITVMSTDVEYFWHMTLYVLVNSYWPFLGASCLHVLHSILEIQRSPIPFPNHIDRRTLTSLSTKTQQKVTTDWTEIPVTIYESTYNTSARTSYLTTILLFGKYYYFIHISSCIGHVRVLFTCAYSLIPYGQQYFKV
jgi:hypothetical protein